MRRKVNSVFAKGQTTRRGLGVVHKSIIIIHIDGPIHRRREVRCTGICYKVCIKLKMGRKNHKL